MSTDQSLEHAVAWASRQPTPTSAARLAFVVPQLVPYASLLLQRLRSAAVTSAWRVHVVGGLPLVGTPAGRRLRQTLRCLEADLSGATMIDLLPSLRRGLSDAPRGDALWEPRLSRNRAAAIVYETGSHPSPSGPDRWAERVLARAKRLRDAIERSLVAEQIDRAAQRTLTVERQIAERWLRDVSPIVPALQALDRLADRIAAGAPLPQLWQEVCAFVKQWLLLPPDPPNALAAMDAHLRGLSEGSSRAALTGSAALAFIAAELAVVRCDSAPLAEAMVLIADPAVDLAGVAHSLCRVAEGADTRLFGAALDGGRHAWLEVGHRLDGAAEAAVSRDTRPDLEGDLGAARALVPVPGLSQARPLSASALGMLLGCPYRFLSQRLLRCNPSPSLPRNDGLDPVVYGALFHAAAEELFRTCGPALCSRSGSVEQWRAVGREVADAAFDSLLCRYPLWGAANVARERQRLGAQVVGLVNDEWQRDRREFLASEWRFGEPAAVAIGPSDATLFVRGSVDRVDRLSGGGLSLRDFKTGGLSDLDRQPINPSRDLQLGVYVLVVEAVGYVGDARIEEAVYVQPGDPRGSLRRFAGAGLDSLRSATNSWLRTAHALLSGGVFPRTPHTWDCRICPFVPLCGADGPAQAMQFLQQVAPDHSLFGYRQLKLGAQHG